MTDAPPLPTTATQRVTTALAAGQVPARRDVERSLRECWNLSARQARRFAAEGVRALGTDQAADLAERLEALELAIRTRTR